MREKSTHLTPYEQISAIVIPTLPEGSGRLRRQQSTTANVVCALNDAPKIPDQIPPLRYRYGRDDGGAGDGLRWG